MQLLISVGSAAEAREALAGGADIIDAKDPLAGALGVVPLDTMRAIAAVAGTTCIVTAALGDADDEQRIHDVARAYKAAGAALVKVGFAGVSSPERVHHLLAAAVRGAGGDVIAVAYADGEPATGITAATVLTIAAEARARGVLLDTADKSGFGLRRLVSDETLREWVASAHQLGLLAAVAGQLTAADLPFVRDAGADVAGIRGAACEGRRSGPVTAARVRDLRQRAGAA